MKLPRDPIRLAKLIDDIATVRLTTAYRVRTLLDNSVRRLYAAIVAASPTSFYSRARVVFLAALLLVPVVLSGHTHVGRITHPCSICTVTHHAPIVRAPALPALAAGTAYLAFVAPYRPAGGRVEQARQTGRAPPLGLLTVA